MIYKGKLEVKTEETQSIKVATHHEFSNFKLTPEFLEYYKNLNASDKDIIFNYLSSQSPSVSEVEEEQVIAALNNALNALNLEPTKNVTDILYSEIEINGIKYGQELFTGLCFPLFQIGNGISCNYLLSVVSDYEVSNCGPYPDTTDYTDYILDRTIDISIPEVPKCVSLITPISLANNNEISAYLDRLNSGLFHKQREQLFRKKLTYLHNSNVYVDTNSNEITTSQANPLAKKF